MTTDIRRFEGESYLDFKKRYLASLAGEAVPEVVKDVAGSGMQGAKVVGSKFMDILNELDRPRGFGAGIWDELSPGAGDNVMDTRSFGQRLLEGGIEGWKDPSSKSYGDEFTSYYPKWLTDIPYLGATLKTGTEIGANIGGDFLTYTPAGAVTVPFKIIKGISNAVAASKAGSAVLRSKAVTDVLESFNVYTGDAAKSHKLVNMLRLEDRGADISAIREAAELNLRLEQIAKESGETLPDIKRAILDAIEAGETAGLARYGDDAIKFADDEIDFYKKLKETENAHGITTADLMRSVGEDGKQILIPGIGMTRAMQMGVGGYVPHILQRGTLGYKVKSLMHRAMPFTSQRKIAGTISEINAKHGRKLFMDDPVALHVLRGMWSARATAASRMVNNAGEEFGIRIGKTAKDKSGNTVYYDTAGNKIDDTVFADPIPGTSQYMLPLDMARVIQRQHRVLSSPEEVKGMLKTYDEIQNWWKKYALATRPAWHTRNAFGNFWNAYFIGGLTDPRLYGEAAAIQRAMKQGDDFLSSYIGKRTAKVHVDPAAEVAGTGMTRQEIFEEAMRRGVYESGMYGSDIGQSILRQSGRQSNIPGATEWKGINKMFAAGKTLENNARLALFVDGIKKGKSLDDAALNVRKSLFDYSDLSEFEKRVMKRLFPFYTWTRKNIPAQLVAMVKHPDRANKINIMVDALQGDVKKVDESDIEDWVKGQFPIMRPDTAEDTYTFITTMSYMPTAELGRLFQKPEQVRDLAGGMLSPVLKVPLELIINYDTFRGQKIDKSQRGMFFGDFGENFFDSYPGQRTTVKEYGKDKDVLVGSESFLGINMTPKQKHLAQSIVLLGEVDRLNPMGIFGDDEGNKSWAGAERRHHDIPESARWIRAILGARIYKRKKGKTKHSKYRQLETDIQFLQRAVAQAARQNDDVRLRHLNLQLQNVYKRGGDL